MAYWYYHVADAILIVLSYLLLAKLALSLLASSDNFVHRAATTLTNPLVVAVGTITPRLVPPPLLPLAALAWLYAARVILRAGFAATGVRLSLG